MTMLLIIHCLRLSLHLPRALKRALRLVGAEHLQGLVDLDTLHWAGRLFRQRQRPAGKHQNTHHSEQSREAHRCRAPQVRARIF